MPRDVVLDSASKLRLRAADLQRLARDAKHEGVARELDLMALHYLVMVRETLGDDWLTPELFRFGASTLVNDVLMQIVKAREGN